MELLFQGQVLSVQAKVALELIASQALPVAVQAAALL
jgi:hypothetical protein